MCEGEKLVMDSQSLKPFVHRKLFGGGRVGGEGKETEVGNLPEPTVRLFRCHPITLPFVSPHGTEQERSKALYHFILLCGEVYYWSATVTRSEVRAVKSILSCGTDIL